MPNNTKNSAGISDHTRVFIVTTHPERCCTYYWYVMYTGYLATSSTKHAPEKDDMGTRSSRFCEVDMQGSTLYLFKLLPIVALKI